MGLWWFSLATQDMLFDKMMSNVKEVKARGAVVLGLTTEKHKEIEKTADHVFYIPSTEDILLPSLAVVPLQLFCVLCGLYERLRH